MPGNSSVQFYGIDAVINAFENRGAEAWAICNNKMFNFRGIGADTLKTFLQMLMEGGTSALYTLRVYDDIEDEKNIKDTTPADGSFNFRLNEKTEYIPGAMNGMRQSNNEDKILAKLDALEKRFEDLEEKEPESKLGLIGEIMEHPTIGPMMPKIIETIAGFFMKPGIPTQNYLPSNYNEIANHNASINGIDENKIINDAILELKKYDTNLGSHLQKLVVIAKTDPGTFKMFLNLLDQ